MTRSTAGIARPDDRGNRFREFSLTWHSGFMAACMDQGHLGIRRQDRRCELSGDPLPRAEETWEEKEAGKEGTEEKARRTEDGCSEMGQTGTRTAPNNG